MTEFDLFDSIGNVDDELIEKAVKPKMNSTNMRLFLITGSIAACAVIAVTVVFLTSGNNTALETSVPSIGGYTEKGAEISSDITTGGANSEIPHTEESYDTDVEIITSDIFYVKEGKNQLVIAVGCTGGKHRSVCLAEELYNELSKSAEYGLRIEHRDIDKDTSRQKIR